MEQKLLENHIRYLERIKFFKRFGYDIEKERNFILEKSKPLSGDILEVGTGKGYFALELAKRGYTFISVDISEEEQDFARLNVAYFGFKKQVHFKIENAECLSFKDASFDVIFSVNTIHHLTDSLKVVNELMRVVTCSGKIVLSDFNEEGLKLMDTIHESEGRKHKASSITLSDIKNYLNSKNFSIKQYKSKFQDVLIAYRN